MRHLKDGTLRRMQDEPLSTTGAEKDHYASCADCRQRAMAIATEAERAAMLMAVPDLELQTQAALTRLRRSAATQNAYRPSLLASLKGLFVSGSNRSVRPVAALALATTMMVALVATGAAENFVKVFEPRQFQAVQVNPASLRTLPDLSQFGGIKATKTPQFMAATGLPDAASRSGLTLLAVGGESLPSRVQGGPSYVVMSALQASFTFSAAKAQAWASAHGKTLPPMPGGLDGSTLTVDAGPAVLAIFGGSSDTIARAAGTADKARAAGTGEGAFDPTSLKLPDIAVVQMKSPTVTSSGASVQEIEDYLVSLPGFPQDLASQIRSIGDPTTTLPVPVPTGQQSHQVDIQGVSGLFVGDSTGLGSGMIWSKNGVLFAAVGTMTESEITAVARSLH
jgi:anti-sigma factor RsiW